MKKIRLYNIIFPLWMLIMLPFSVLLTTICVVANALIDASVLYFGSKKQQLQFKEKEFFKTWLKVFVSGWIADFVGALILIAVSMILPYQIANAMMFNVFTNIWAFFIVVIITGFSGWLIYLFNLKWSFKKLSWSLEKKKKIALYLAIITAPYLFMFPTGLFL